MNLKDLVYQGIKRKVEKSDAEYRERASTLNQNVLYASELGYCPRRWAFNRVLNREKNDFNDKTLLIFADGNATEDTLISALRESDFHIESTQLRIVTQLNDEWEIRGKADIVGKLDGQLMPVEIKSMNSKNFAIAQNFGPQRAHKYQTAFYVTGLQTQTGRLLYKEKNSGEMQEFEMTLESSHELLDRQLDYYTQAIKSLSEGKDLRPIPGIQAKHLATPDECRYCTYHLECQKAEAASPETVTDEGLPW